MTETDAAADRSSLVPGVHRLIRAIDGKEGPFAGALVAFDDAVAVCVDFDRLGGWPGWAFSDAEHVCGALDIRRRADGHDVLLPWCTQRIEVFLGRRDASGSPLAPGELGTLVASLLRGVRELGADAEAVGDWWLTGDGRPLFVHGDGGTARARTATLIERMLRQQADRATVRVLEEMVAALRGPRHPADDDLRWEQQLFAHAAPRALQLDVFAPERVSDVSQRLVAADTASSAAELARHRRATDERRNIRPRGEDALRSDHHGRRGMRRRVGRADRADRSRARRMLDDQRKLDRSGSAAVRLVRYLTDGARVRVSRLRERVPERVFTQRDQEATRKPTSRRRAVLLAGALGAIVLIVGLLWPGDGDDAPAEAASQKPPTAAASAEDPRGESQDPDALPDPPPSEPTPGEATPDADTALVAVPVLLDAISVCVQEGEEHCARAVAEGAKTPAEGVASLGAAASTATLVDDYGDVAVIRLTPLEAGIVEQMLVVERRNEIWLVRDVYDVAHQPD